MAFILLLVNLMMAKIIKITPQTENVLIIESKTD